jgi:hypothetical protein
MSNEQDKLIKELYRGLQSYYDYSSNLEDAIEECGDVVSDAVYKNMPKVDDDFNHKDCRFLLSEVENYLGKV